MPFQPMVMDYQTPYSKVGAQIGGAIEGVGNMAAAIYQQSKLKKGHEQRLFQGARTTLSRMGKKYGIAPEEQQQILSQLDPKNFNNVEEMEAVYGKFGNNAIALTKAGVDPNAVKGVNLLEDSEIFAATLDEIKRTGRHEALGVAQTGISRDPMGEEFVENEEPPQTRGEGFRRITEHLPSGTTMGELKDDPKVQGYLGGLPDQAQTLGPKEQAETELARARIKTEERKPIESVEERQLKLKIASLKEGNRPTLPSKSALRAFNTDINTSEKLVNTKTTLLRVLKKAISEVTNDGILSAATQRRLSEESPEILETGTDIKSLIQLKTDAEAAIVRIKEERKILEAGKKEVVKNLEMDYDAAYKKSSEQIGQDRNRQISDIMNELEERSTGYMRGQSKQGVVSALAGTYKREENIPDDVWDEAAQMWVEGKTPQVQPVQGNTPQAWIAAFPNMVPEARRVLLENGQEVTDELIAAVIQYNVQPDKKLQTEILPQ